ncbi:hypothetical protein B7670_08665, partial [Campylobacter coli]|nr:hypothetical protein [Campylobacter coli]EAL1095547.1 hypothetical protein [Campylobacter coli]EAL2844925.1 hypothetical protein [Campylobacter coli]EAL3539867.1 hypothetical protein [Campylobacter coli]
MLNKKDLVNFFLSFSSNKNFKRYDFENYDCEISNYISEFKNGKHPDHFFNFWNKHSDKKFFELKHPIYNHIKTRAITNVSFREGVFGNYIFFIDSTNKYYWILGIHFYLNILICDDGIYYNPFSPKIIQDISKGKLKSISDIFICRVDELFFKDIDFGFSISCSRPAHYFRDYLPFLFALPYTKKIDDFDSFFILNEHKCLLSKDKKVFINPFDIKLQQDGYQEIFRNQLQEKIYNETPKATLDRKYDLVLWFCIGSEHRVWLNQTIGIVNILTEFAKYYNSILVYFDGMTAYSNGQYEQLLSKKDQKIYFDIVEEITKMKLNNKINMVFLGGQTYFQKIALCKNVNICYVPHGTATVVPEICKIPGIAYWNGGLNNDRTPPNRKQLISASCSEQYFLSVGCNDDIYKRNYHIPWEYLFNLSLDLLHNESIKKINIPEMIEVKFEWFFRNIDLINKQCSTIEKIYRLALLFEDIKEIEAYNILINKIMSKLDKELQEINKIKQVKYKEKIKTKSSEIDKQIFYLEKKSQDKTTQIKSLQANIKDNEAKLVQIQNLNNTLNNTIKEKDQLINSKSTQLNQIQSKLSFQTKYGTAK